MNVVRKQKLAGWSTDRPVNLGTPAVVAFAVVPFVDPSPYVCVGGGEF